MAIRARKPAGARDLVPVVNQSAYEGAAQGRRLGGWNAPGSGPNRLLSGGLGALRRRSRDAYRNNAWVGHGVDRLAINEVGTGVVPRSRAADQAFREAANALWDRSAPEVDADGVLDVYGLQAQASRGRNIAGEVFIRRRPRAADSGLAVPVQFQVLAAEFVPETYDRDLSGGAVIRAGIELDARGRRLAYWMYREHPGERPRSTGNFGHLVRVPAADVIHHYLPSEPGQLRGAPVDVRALVKAYVFDSYDDAELTRKQTRAAYTGFLKRPGPEEDDWLYDPMTGAPLKVDASGVPTLEAEPGTWLSGMPGEEPFVFDGDNTGQGYADFMRQQLLGLAVGLGLPYELLTGDWSKVNDRLVRAILNEFRRGIEAIQDHLMIHQVCRQLWAWWMDAAVLAGVLQAPGYASRWREYQAHEWRPHGWAYVNPEQDVNAKLRAIAGNLASRDAEVAKTGWDADEIDRDNVEAEKRLRDLRQAAGLPENPPNNPQQGSSS